MRVISLVPSWTETLLEAGIDVVGRTAFCIHPQEKVKSIPIVGGTKTVHWNKVQKLSADLLLVDKEENLKEVVERSPLPLWSTHVQSVEFLERELRRLGVDLRNARLREWADWAGELAAQPPLTFASHQPPALIEWLRRPAKGWNPPNQFIYLIWKDPWMAVSRETFLGNMLHHLGWGDVMWHHPDSKYPKVDLAEFDPESTLLLYSSEPYPFAKHRHLLPQSFSGALVDGELLSWFGIRALRFLNRQRQGTS